MRSLPTLLGAFACLILSDLSYAQTSENKSAATSWSIKGDYLDACSCPYVCMCEFGVDPQTHGCQGIGGFKIRQGNYGEISLSGVTAAFYIKPGLEWGLYVEESATDNQREALQMVIRALFSNEGKYLGMKSSKILFSKKSENALLEVPGVMKVRAERVQNNKKPITVANGYNPLADKVMAAKASVNEFKDFGNEWKYEGRNSWLGTFNKRGGTGE
jgi:hypothetical protein